MTLAPTPSIVLLALASSAHCAVMCGPLCRAIGNSAASQSSAVKGVAWGYQLGRVFGYATLGACAALLGRGAVANTLAPVGDLFTGLVVFATLGKAWTLARSGKPLFGHLKKPLIPLLAVRAHVHLLALFRAVLERLPLPKPFAAGLSTSLLPCGFLFAALGHAAVTLDLAAGAVSMAVFALATAPAVAAGARLTQWLMSPSPTPPSWKSPPAKRSVVRPGCPRFLVSPSAKMKRNFAAGILVLAALLLAATALRRESSPSCQSVSGFPFASLEKPLRDTLSPSETFRPTPWDTDGGPL
jgi:sulfite exporter TauE/SafE